MAKRKRISHDPCGVGETLAMISGRWKGPLLWWLNQDTHRFGELRRRIPEVTARVLTSQLRQLERDGFVRRRQYLEIPPRVEYSLTALGKSLVPMLDVIQAWGRTNLGRVEAHRTRFDRGTLG
jgi:DNA-binding HxlR family transcriptional regulator